MHALQYYIWIDFKTELLMKKPYKYLMVFLSFALTWAQSAIAVHDHNSHKYPDNHLLSYYYNQVHYNHDHHQQKTDDCVTCKVIEGNKDKINDEKFDHVLNINHTDKIYSLTVQSFQQSLWVKQSSRAPPLS